MKTGERQVAPTVNQIRADHSARYRWARTQIAPGDDVLDMACGVGYGSAIMSDVAGYVVAGDLEADAISYARTHFSRGNVAHLVLDLTAAGKLPDADVVVSFETIEHVVDGADLLRKFIDAAPVLLGSVPNEAAIPFDPKRFPFHVRHYTAQQIVATLLAAGYSRVDLFGQRNHLSTVGAYSDDCRTIVFKATRAALP